MRLPGCSGALAGVPLSPDPDFGLTLTTRTPVTVPAALADALRDRYVLDRELGRGAGG
jgi:hypothetical protein